MNYRSRTDERCGKLPADASCSLTRWQHFVAWNDVTPAMLKVWRQIENPTLWIDAYLLEGHYSRLKV